ncbi:MAG: hypothetical protein ACM3W4_01455 [Ignavibacteriales bacterium]
MTRAADYLERAAAVEANARQMSLDEHRDRLLELAAAWRQMAEQELRREQLRHAAPAEDPRLDGPKPLA